MIIRDAKVDSASAFPQKTLVVPVAPAINLTDGVLYAHKVASPTRVVRASIFTRLLTAAAAFKITKAPANGLAIGTALAIDAVPEKFKTSDQVTYMNGAVPTVKAATTAITFTAAYTVNNATTAGFWWGAFLVQLNVTTGAISTKATAADQAFVSEAQAVANLPAADASNVILGHITVETKTGAKWTANTDDLTAASDVTAANFTARPAIPMSATPVALTDTAFTFGSGYTVLDLATDDYLLVCATTDGTGALTNGTVSIDVRPKGLRGDA